MQNIDQQLDEIFATRNRENMAPTLVASSPSSLKLDKVKILTVTALPCGGMENIFRASLRTL